MALYENGYMLISKPMMTEFTDMMCHLAEQN